MYLLSSTSNKVKIWVHNNFSIGDSVWNQFIQFFFTLTNISVYLDVVKIFGIIFYYYRISNSELFHKSSYALGIKLLGQEKEYKSSLYYIQAVYLSAIHGGERNIGLPEFSNGLKMLLKEKQIIFILVILIFLELVVVFKKLIS